MERTYYKEFRCQDKRVSQAATTAQIAFAHDLAIKTGSEIRPSKHQLGRSFFRSDMTEAIALMKEGKKIVITL